MKKPLAEDEGLIARWKAMRLGIYGADRVLKMGKAEFIKIVMRDLYEAFLWKIGFVEYKRRKTMRLLDKFNKQYQEWFRNQTGP